MTLTFLNLFCVYQPTCILNITVIPPNLAANYDSGLFSKLNGTQHPSKPQMNFSKRKKSFCGESHFACIFRPIRVLIETRALPQSSQLSKLPKIINHVRRLKFRGGAKLRPSIAMKFFLEPEHFYARNRTRSSTPL